ncbi:MAG: hypothetical protein IJJ86_00045 [Clostridia bacterium]|nr:hypothetical protein [Clostridia bacterium]
METVSGKTVHKDNALCSKENAMINTMDKNIMGDRKRITKESTQDIAEKRRLRRKIRRQNRPKRERRRSNAKKCGKIFLPKDCASTHKNDLIRAIGKYREDKGPHFRTRLRDRGETARGGVYPEEL